MPGYPAQPSVVDQAWTDQLWQDSKVLIAIWNDLQGAKPSKKRKEEMRKELAGVVGHCEALRMALRSPGG